MEEPGRGLVSHSFHTRDFFESYEVDHPLGHAESLVVEMGKAQRAPDSLE